MEQVQKVFIAEATAPEQKEFLLPGGVLDVHFKFQGSDGVSLQGSGLDSHLSRLGYDIHECASDVTRGLRIPELSYQTEENAGLRSRIFTRWAMSGEEDRILAEIKIRAGRIGDSVEAYVNRNNIKIIHVRNIMCLPLHLGATQAFYNLAKGRPDIRFIFQHHDSMWEGPAAQKYITPYQKINELMDEIIIPDLPNVTHVVINPISARTVYKKRGITPYVIPDGFDFDRKPPSLTNGRWQEEDRAFHERFGIAEGDLVVGMMTRIAINKNVEAAIQFVRALEDKLKSTGSVLSLGEHHRPFGSDNRVVLLIVQKEDINDSSAYYERLTAYAASLGVELKMIGDSVVADHAANGDARIPFYHVYPHVDLVVYPSEFENFGNQAVEAVWAKRPIVLFEYPVFFEYIRPHLLHYVSLGDHRTLSRSEERDLNVVDDNVIDRAAGETIALLTDPDRIQTETEENVRSLRALCDLSVVGKQFLALYAEPLG